MDGSSDLRFPHFIGPAYRGRRRFAHTFVLAGSCREWDQYQRETADHNSICLCDPSRLYGHDLRECRLIIYGGGANHRLFSQIIDLWREMGGPAPINATAQRSATEIRNLHIETNRMMAQMGADVAEALFYGTFTARDRATRGAMERSFQLLLSILPKPKQEELNKCGCVRVMGESGRLYVLQPGSQTVILNRPGGTAIAAACLQLTIEAPPYDRMIAEYLLIRNDEPRYLMTANTTAIGNVDFEPMRRPRWVDRMRGFLP